MTKIQYPFPYELPVQWGDMDALGHINNVMYIRYFETSRIAFFNESAIWQELEKEGLYIILAKIDCNYKIPIVFPDTITVQSGIVSIGNSSITVHQQVISLKYGLAAEGNAVVVCIDKNLHKTTAIPAHIRSLIEEKYLPLA